MSPRVYAPGEECSTLEARLDVPARTTSADPCRGGRARVVHSTLPGKAASSLHPARAAAGAWAAGIVWFVVLAFR